MINKRTLVTRSTNCLDAQYLLLYMAKLLSKNESKKNICYYRQINIRKQAQLNFLLSK